MGNSCTKPVVHNDRQQDCEDEEFGGRVAIRGVPNVIRFFMQYGADLTPGNNIRGPRRVRPGMRLLRYGINDCTDNQYAQGATLIAVPGSVLSESYMTKTLEEMDSNERTAAIQNPAYQMERFDRFDHDTLVETARDIADRISLYGVEQANLSRDEHDAVVGMIRRTHHVNLLRYGTINPLPPDDMAGGDI